MLALITGASSGIGYDMAKIMSEKGYDLILVARRKERLLKLKQTLSNKVTVIVLDLSVPENCYALYEKVRLEPIDMVINNAGFGLFGRFSQQPIDKELEMIDLNIKAVHILTKLFIQDFIERDQGYILNVASSAAFQPGPLMATYYATKAYVLHLTEAIYEELRRQKSRVYIGCLCPGPVATEFNQVANVKFSLKGLSSYEVARYATKKMMQRKRIIIPGILMKLNVACNRFIPKRLLLRITYHIQRQKDKNNEKYIL